MAIPPIKVEVSADIKKLQDGLNRGTDQLDKFSKASKASTGKINQLNDALAQADGRLGDAASRVQTATSNFRNFANIVGRTPAIIGAVTVGLANLAAAGFAAATSAALTFASRLKEIRDEAAQLNMPVDELSRLKYAADSANVGSSNLTSGLETLKEAMNAVKTGEDDNTGAKALEVMGIKALDASGKLRPMSEVLSEVANKFSGYADGANKTALATALFGDEIGIKLIPLLNQGSESLALLKQESDKVGATMKDTAAPAADKLHAAQVKLKASIDGLVNAIGEAFLPRLADIVSRLAELSVEFINNSGKSEYWAKIVGNSFESVANKAKSNLSTVGFMIKSLWSFRGKSLEDLGGMFNKNIENAQIISKINKAAGVGLPAAISGLTPQAPAIPSDKTTAAKGGGGAAAAKTDPNVALLFRLAERAKIIEESYMTEEQRLRSKQEREVALLEEAHALEMQMRGANNEEKAIEEEMHLKRMEELHANHQKALAKLEASRQNQTLTATAGFFGSLVTLTDAFGKKNTALSKSFGIAEAIINTYVGVTKALSTLPPPASYIAAATTLAKGLAAVGVIARTNTSKGGNSAAGGGGAIASAGGGGGMGATGNGSGGMGNAVYINLQGQSFGRDQVRSLIEQIAAYQKDGGQVVFA